MTGADDQGPPGDPVDAPLSLELLADLHAGVLDEQIATPLRQRVAADAGARAIMAALEATVADLEALPRRHEVRIPETVALRLEAALAAEARRRKDHPTPDPPQDEDFLTASVADFGARRRRRARWFGAGLLAAAATTVVALSSGQLAGVRWQIPGSPRTGDALTSATGVQPAAPMALTRSSLGSAVDQALGAHDSGPLSPSGMMDSCLEANGMADIDPLGTMEVTLDGHEGVLIVLPASQHTQLRLLVVGPDCGPGNPSPMADTEVGR